MRRDNGEGYREMLERLAAESGIETPTVEDLARLDRTRKGKKLSNADWVRSIVLVTRSSAAKLPSKSYPKSSRSIRKSWLASSAKHDFSRH